MSAFSNTAILNNKFITHADVFVDFFFVLSGFVVCYSYQTINSAKELKTFLFKRIRRLYPLHLVLLLLFLFLELTKLVLYRYVAINNTLDNSTITFFTSLFLVNSIKFPGVNDLSWNMVSWSISAELISYIVFAFSCFFVAKLKLERFKIFFYAILSLVPFWVLYRINGNFKIDYTYNYGFLRGLIGFFAGTVCFYFFNYSYNKVVLWKRAIFNILELLMVLIIIILTCRSEELKAQGYWYEIVFLISIFIFALEKGVISNLIKHSSVLLNIGKYSYSIYMIHTLFISIFNVIFIRILKLPDTAYTYLFVFNYIIIYIVSAWTYKHIEMRFNKSKTAHKGMNPKI